MKEEYTLEDAEVSGVAPWTDLVREDFHVKVFKDKYPVTDGHLLFVPQYTADGVIVDCFGDALTHGKEMVEKGEWDGFNIGINNGSVAGQTIFHCHIHLIPRRIGDVANPIGGVRNIIPGKGEY